MPEAAAALARPHAAARAVRPPSHVLPVLAVLGALGLVWYVAAVWLNAPQVIERVLADQPDWGLGELLPLTWSMERPVLPAPHQIALDMWRSIVDWPLDSPRSLLFHTGVTAASTLLGFVMGTLLGLALAVAIVHSRTLDRSLFPWIIASQTVPVLAIAPIVIVVLGSMGLTGVFPKSMISMYLCFFPVTVALVKGLRSPGVIELELMHTYAAGAKHIFWMLRVPASLPFLFPVAARGHRRGLGRRHRRRAAHRRAGRAGRAAAYRLVLRQHGADLVGAGDGRAARPGADGRRGLAEKRLTPGGRK